MSKNNRVFNTGAVRDSVIGKEDYIETISFLALKRYASYMTSCQDKYGQGNWRKGIPIVEYEKSMLRHIQKYLSNKYEGTNIEPNVDHLSAALFNLQGILHEEEKLVKNKDNKKMGDGHFQTPEYTEKDIPEYIYDYVKSGLSSNELLDLTRRFSNDFELGSEIRKRILNKEERDKHKLIDKQ